MKEYQRTGRVEAAHIDRIELMTDHHGGCYEVTLNDGTQRYEPIDTFRGAGPGDYHVRPVASRLDPLPPAYFIHAVDFEASHREVSAAPARVPTTRIDALVASLVIHCLRAPGTTTTVAIACLPGSDGLPGFTVAEGHAYCADPRDFTEAKGIELATQDVLEKARARLWDFEAYSVWRQRQEQQ